MRDLLTTTAVVASICAAARFVQATATDNTFDLAAADDDKLMGVTRRPVATAGARADIGIAGEHELEFGGTVTAGDFLTSDGTGRGVVCTTTGQRYGAMALEGGGTGTIGKVLIIQGTFAAEA